MLEIYTVAFFGHRVIANIGMVEKLLDEQVLKLIDEKEYVDFYVGRNGDFDICAVASVKRVREKYKNSNSTINLMLPYKTAEYVKNKSSFEEFYNSIEISDSAREVFPKKAIQARNREMADRADMIICYVEHNKGGAFQAVKYAEKQGKRIINLCSLI